MNVQELRIGNKVGVLVYKTNNYIAAKIDVNILHQVIEDERLREEKADHFVVFKPLPLNANWLKSLGFVIVTENEEVSRYVFSKRHTVVAFRDDVYSLYWRGFLIHTNIQWVHQLQNYYFVLEKEELE